MVCLFSFLPSLDKFTEMVKKIKIPNVILPFQLFDIHYVLLELSPVLLSNNIRLLNGRKN